MTNKYLLPEQVTMHEKATQFLLKGEYIHAASLYEQAIEAKPETRLNYWYLGLMLLLQGLEVEAQTTWLVGMADGEPEQVEQWTAELLQVLEAEAVRQQDTLKNLVTAWAIRQHIREINPQDINNVLHLMGLSILLDGYTAEEPKSLGAIELLQADPLIEVDFDLLMQVLKSVLDYAPLYFTSAEFAEACFNHIQEPKVFLQIIITSAVEIGQLSPFMAVRLLELCARINDDRVDQYWRVAILNHLAAFYQNSRQYDRGIETARLCYDLAESLPQKVSASHNLLRGLLGGVGYWEEVGLMIQKHQTLLESMFTEGDTSLDLYTFQSLYSTTYFFPYFEDRGQKNRQIQNQMARFCYENAQVLFKEQISHFREGHLERRHRHVGTRPLKIGYLSHCFKTHSVGWISRWLFQHHDRERFEIYTYFMTYKKIQDDLQEWFVSKSDKVYKGATSIAEIAEQIYQDEVDILIDLDSITLDATPTVMALKPAPVQVTWLGWDASGLPSIDYFIADPYVLPESADDYYSEKIWRLPQTYVAVDGFEVLVPSLHREHLNIPSDAVVYISSQAGYKRHPDTVRLQLKIIAAVPNSYFLIRGSSGKDGVERLFTELGKEEGVESEQLRFLPNVELEATHRANLGIADVALDTYPYNGATTTLETLWMGVPLVTLVGEQFAARNSYTMMMNVGVTEGIAWTDEEYVEWGIRFGKEPILRQQVSGRLRESRNWAPLWKGEKFTRDMENAYEQMWQIYLDGNY